MANCQPRKAQRITTHVVDEIASKPTTAANVSTSQPRVDPVIPPLNAYGTFDPNDSLRSRVGSGRSPSRVSHVSDVSNHSQNRPLLPSPRKPTQGPEVARDLIPFASLSTSLMRKLGFLGSESLAPNVTVPPLLHINCPFSQFRT